MKKILILIGLFGTFCLNAQETEKFNVSFGINGGYGQNINGYRLSETSDYSFYDLPSQHSLGIDFGVFITEKLRFRVDLRYVKMQYGVNWNNDDYGINKTEVNLYNFDLNFRLDYRFFSKNNFELYISPGFITEYVVDDEHKNYYDDGSTSFKTYNFYPSNAFASTITGASCALISKYKITNNIGITLTPEYTYFLREFYHDNSGAYQRFGVNFGVEFTF